MRQHRRQRHGAHARRQAHPLRDVFAVLSDDAEEIRAEMAIFSRPEVQSSHVRRGTVGIGIVETVSSHDTARYETYHRIIDRIRKDAGSDALLALKIECEIDERFLQRQRLLRTADKMASNVHPRDIHMSSGSDYDDAIRAIVATVEADLAWEEKTLVPALRACKESFGAVESDRKALDFDIALAHAPIRPHLHALGMLRRGRVGSRLLRLEDKFQKIWVGPHKSAVS